MAIDTLLLLLLLAAVAILIIHCVLTILPQTSISAITLVREEWSQRRVPQGKERNPSCQRIAFCLTQPLLHRPYVVSRKMYDGHYQQSHPGNHPH